MSRFSCSASLRNTITTTKPSKSPFQPIQERITQGEHTSPAVALNRQAALQLAIRNETEAEDFRQMATAATNAPSGRSRQSRSEARTSRCSHLTCRERACWLDVLKVESCLIRFPAPQRRASLRFSMVVTTSGLNSTRNRSNLQTGALKRPSRPAQAWMMHCSPAAVAADADCDHGPTGDRKST